MIFGGFEFLALCRCNNDDPVTPDAQPEIVFAKESLDVPAEGGPFPNRTRSKTLSQMRPCLPNATTVDNGHRYQNRRGHLFNVTKKRNSGKERGNHRSFVRGYPAGAFPLQQNRRPVRGGIYDNDFDITQNIPNYSPSWRPGNVLSVEHSSSPGCRRFQDG